MIEFRSDMRVTLIDSMGSDRSIAEAARVSTRTDDLGRPHEGLVRRLWRDGHTSPFEQCELKVRVEVPLFVAREWHRHRTQMFNEVSGRYAELAPVFYVPGDDRPLVQTGKSMDYQREAGTWKQLEEVILAHEGMARVGWAHYRSLLEAGVAREVARGVLPVSLFTTFYAKASLLNWFRFIELRTDESALWEIRRAAEQVEAMVKGVWPVAHTAFRS